MSADDHQHRTWVRHATAAGADAAPDLVAVPHYDDRVSADHPEDQARYAALLAARASRCAAVGELDALAHDTDPQTPPGTEADGTT